MTRRRWVVLAVGAAALLVGVGISVLFSGGPTMPDTGTHSWWSFCSAKPATCRYGGPAVTTTAGAIPMPLGEMVVVGLGDLLVAVLAVALIVYLARSRRRPPIHPPPPDEPPAHPVSPGSPAVARTTLIGVTEQLSTTSPVRVLHDDTGASAAEAGTGAAAATPMVVGLLDGRLVSSTVPLLRPDDAGVTRGDGVFETTLVHAGEPRDLDEHLARLRMSAKLTDLIVPEPADWLRGIDAVLGAWTGGDMVLRLVATRGPEVGGPTCFVTGSALTETAVRQRQDGIRVLLLDRGFSGSGAAAAPWLLAGAKTLSYAINMAALRYAAAHDADDVIFIGSDGAVLEAPTATVVVTRGRTLLTPPLEGVLDGITVVRLIRAARAAGWSAAYQSLTRDDLIAADAVFLASSVRLLAPVISIDGVTRGEAGRTSELLELLECP